MAEQESSRRLLFLAPIIPSDHGNGLAMRCGFLLDAYARAFQVDLAVVPLAAAGGELDDFVMRRVRRANVFAAAEPDSLFGLIERLKDDAARRAAFERYGRPALMSRLTEPLRADLASWCAAANYKVVHVSRLYLAELAAPWLAARGAFCVLDCDEDDAAAHHRIARMYQRAGDGQAAAWARAEAAAFARVAAEWLPRFDCLMSAAASESRSLSQRAGNRPVCTIPNTVAVRPAAARRPHGGTRRARTILFVGNMSYAPNAEAVKWFAARVWPRLRQSTKAPLRLLIVGANPPASIARLDGGYGIRVTGAVAAVAPFYAAADLAVVPLRGGGGTRIKLIEAAERGVPLVSTAFGACGTSLRDGRELLIAEDPAAFAAACTLLLAEPRRAAAMAARARRRVRLHYDARAWAARVVGLVRAGS